MGTNYTLIAACVAAFAALLSAGISALVVFGGKRKDFKNDYYKKMIDRRLAAYEQLEVVMSAFSRRRQAVIKTVVGNSEQEFYSFFVSDDAFETFHNLVSDLHDKHLWFSQDVKQEIHVLQNKLAAIGNGMKLFVGQNAGPEAMIELGIKNDAEMHAFRKKLLILIKKELVEIADINKFFKGLRTSAGTTH